MQNLIFLLYLPLFLANNTYKWGSYKPHLIYSLSEEDLFPITVRFAFGYRDSCIPIRYDLRENKPLDLILNYNFHNGKDFSEQTIYDKTTKFQFKTITIRENIENPLQQWSIYMLNSQSKGFLKRMLFDLLKKTSILKNEGLFNHEGFFENAEIFPKIFQENDEVIFAFSLGLEQLSKEIALNTKDFYLMKLDNSNNTFLIRNKFDHEIISIFQIKFLENEVLKTDEISYKFLRNSDKSENWRIIGQKLKEFIREKKSPKTQENSIKNTAILFRIPIKLNSNFLLHILYKEDLTVSTVSFDDKFSPFIQRLYSKRLDFFNKFIQIFPIRDESSQFLQCSITSFSNLLGGLSYMYGPIKTVSNPFIYTSPKPLFTMTPCRRGFARGFLWDEGFHNMILAQFDSKLSMKILTHWLDTIFEATGWIPREQIRGPEIEEYSSRDFLVQNEKEANPPTIIMVLNYLFVEFKNKRNSEGMAEIGKVWEKAKKWFFWFHESQRINPMVEEYLYKWIVERNGYNIGSGMDDFPRNDGNSGFYSQYHVDLQVWNIVFAENLLPIMEEFERNSEEIEKVKTILIESKENLQKKFKDPSDFLYKDTDGEKFSPHIGYDSLFPLMFGLIEPDSQELANLLNVIKDSNQLWTSAGIRSLSRQDDYYRQNDNYWTSPIWINMNYLVLRGLKKFYMNNEKARRIYEKLRENLMENVCGEWKKKGYFFENFDDINFEGTHHNLFNGWSSLITLIISEKYI